MNLTPLAAKLSKLTYILDQQGKVLHIDDYDKEEGEILQRPTRDQIAELLHMDPNDVLFDSDEETTQASETQPPESESENADENEVEVEDVTEDYYPTHPSAADDDTSDFAEMLNKQSEEELQRKISERTQNEKGKAKVDDLEERRKEWVAFMKERKQLLKQAVPPKYKTSYHLKGYSATGKIISWAYLSDLKVYAVKRERGIDYFLHAHDLKTLPYFEMLQLARLKLLYSEENNLAGWLERQLRFEFRHGWKNLRPQFPKISDHPTRMHPLTGRPVKVTKYKPARKLKKVPLRKMPQNFSDKFRWWYYDNRTAEAVIVLGNDNDVEVIRVLDPMWLRNLSQQDMITLYFCPLFFDAQDMEQAAQFMNVLRVCFAHNLCA